MLVGLIGNLGSGKDSVYETAALLASTHKLPAAERVAFADKLKQYVAAVLGITVEQVEALKNEPDDIIEFEVDGEWVELTMRKLLQQVGSKARKVFGDKFWIDQALPMDTDHSERLIFITDMRYANEAERVRELGGVVIRVTGPDDLKAQASGHDSETELVTIETAFTIDNTVRDDNRRRLIDQTGDLLLALTTENLFVKVLDDDLAEHGAPNALDLLDADQ